MNYRGLIGNPKSRAVALWASVLAAPISGPLAHSEAVAGKWTLEPAKVLGIALGKPLDGSLPACPGDIRQQELSRSLCISSYGSPYEDKVRSIYGLPFPTVRMSATLFLHDGIVESIRFDVNHDDYNQMAAILVEKYGKPTTIETSNVTAGSGARLPSITMLWTGGENTIAFIERYETINNSLVSFTNTATAQRSAEESQRSVAKAAAEL